MHGSTRTARRVKCERKSSGDDESSGVHVQRPPGARVSDATVGVYFMPPFVSVLVIVFATIAEEMVLVTSRHTPNCYVWLTLVCACV